MELTKLTIKEAHDGMRNGVFTAVELAESYLANINDRNGELNAYLEVFDDVLEQAEQADARLRGGERSELLTGIPIAIKDNILIEGRIASAASRILEHYRAAYDATVIAKLKQAGAVFLGRTNMDEFAMGSSNEQSAFGPVKNPHDTTRVSGGSSGGSAVAVAAHMAMAALGSDTAGSIRQPASFCGVVGLKPTYGAVSRHGLIALGSSLDCIGPIARTTEDAEIIFNVIHGKDPLDATSLKANGVDEAPTLRSGPRPADVEAKKLTIGVPRQLLESEGVDVQVRADFDISIEKLKTLGHTVVDVELPNAQYAVPAYYIILPAEASANLARFDGVKYGLHVEGEDLFDDYLKTRGEGFGPEPRRRIILGTYVLSAGYYDAYYNKATAVRALIRNDFEEAFNSIDVIALPTTPGPAFKLGEKGSDPIKMYLEDIFTVPANHTGHPAITIPSGVATEDGKELPLGLQLTAPYLRENVLFSISKQLESLKT